MSLPIGHHRCTVVQPCVNGDRLSQWRMENLTLRRSETPQPIDTKFENKWLRARDDPLCKISCKSVHWGVLGKWVKYNENFSSIYTVSQKNVPLCDHPYLRQILTDFQNFFTGTFCGQVAVVLLLNTPPHLNCVSTLPCETLIVKNV